MRKTVLLSTSACWNCGDDWIREGLLTCLGLRSDVRVLWWNRGWGVKPEFGNSLAVNLDLADYVIMAGTPEWIDLNEGIYKHCLRRGKRMALLGVGRTGGFDEERHEALMGRAREVVDLAIARDDIAAGYLERFGIPHTVMCDPALFCEPVGNDGQMSVVGYRGIGLGPGEKNSHHVIRGGGQSAELDIILVDAFHALPAPKLVTVHDNREVRAAEELFGGQHVFYSSNPADLFRAYAGCGYYIGARIHGFVAALLHGAAAQLIYPTDKAVTMETAITRLGLAGHAKVQVMGTDSGIVPYLGLEAIGQHEIRKRLAEESAAFRAKCKAVGWLGALMR